MSQSVARSILKVAAKSQKHERGNNDGCGGGPFPFSIALGARDEEQTSYGEEHDGQRQSPADLSGVHPLSIVGLGDAHACSESFRQSQMP
jgi:hypothetical protein